MDYKKSLNDYMKKHENEPMGHEIKEGKMKEKKEMKGKSKAKALKNCK